MIPLPIDSHLEELTATLMRSSSIVLVAPPGSGKTTRVPPAILEAGLLGSEHPALVMLQPRRVAARSVAGRIAEERGWTLGVEVGYQIRREKRLRAGTRLRVLTEGILTRQLLADPFLEGVGAVVLDEFHERSIHTDLALALLREVRTTVRDDLRIVVMSATLDAEPIANYLDNGPILRVPGRTHPVSISYRPPPEPRTPLPDRVVDALRDHAPQEPGEILVFLPGVGEITRTAERLSVEAERWDRDVLPLHGQLPASAQDRAIRPGPRRKIVLATNVAETSLTIEGVSLVIDGGLARIASQDPATGLDRLSLSRISRASADQRAGRAGRTGPGRCIRLWDERETAALSPFEPPEIDRVDLTPTALTIAAWAHRDLTSFAWFAPPSVERLEQARRLLERLGALDPKTGHVNDLGHALLAFPIHPRLARMLLALVDDDAVDEATWIAAWLSERGSSQPNAPRRGSGPVTPTRSDLLVLLDRIRSDGSPASVDDPNGPLDRDVRRRIAQTHDDLMRLLESTRKDVDAPQGSNEIAAMANVEDQLCAAVLLGFPDRVVKRRDHDPERGRMVGGRGIRQHPQSTVRQGSWYVAIDPRETTANSPPGMTGPSEATVRIASAIEPDWLGILLPDRVTTNDHVQFDPDRERVVGTRRTLYEDLLLREVPARSVDPEQARALLAEVVLERWDDWLEADEAARDLLRRLEVVRTWMPEGDWPVWDDPTRTEIVHEACQGCQGLDEVRRRSLAPLLQARWNYPQQQALDRHAPRTWTIPTGRAVRLQYGAADQPPVLAARVQELFGLAQTPRIAGGRLTVRVHLLAPNNRPVQITDDLENFWKTTYFQVRKDLRGRYPKHAWPEDPTGAVAQARPTRRPRPES